YIIVRVPIGRFLWLLYHTVFGSRADAITTTGLTGLDAPFLPWADPVRWQLSVAVLSVAAYLLYIVTFLWPVRPARPLQRFAHPVAVLSTPTADTPDTTRSGLPVATQVTLPRVQPLQQALVEHLSEDGPDSLVLRRPST